MATINTATHTIEEGPGYILATDKVTGKKSKMAIDLRGMNDSSRKALYELRLRKDLPSKAKEELEMLLMGEGFMNSVGLMQPNWRRILQNSLQHRNMQLRDRIARIKSLANGSAINRYTGVNEQAVAALNAAAAANVAANAATVAAANAATVAAANAAPVMSLETVSNANSANSAVEEEEEFAGANMPIPGASLPNLGIMRGIRGFFSKKNNTNAPTTKPARRELTDKEWWEMQTIYGAYGGRKKTRKHRKAHKKSRKASKKGKSRKH